MSFDKDLIFVYCQPISNLFCGAVYCVVGQVGKPEGPTYSWSYINKEALLTNAASMIDTLEEEGNIEVDTGIITPKKINRAGINVDRYIQQNLRMLTWRYIYRHKIRQPKVRFCGEGVPFDTDQIEYVTSAHPEEEVIRAIAFLKRHSLIDTHYAAVYPDCDLLNNHGVMDLDSLPTIKKAEYKADFFLKPSLLVNLPNLMIDGFEYMPSKPAGRRHTIFSQAEQERFDYYLLNEESLELPPWWYLVQDLEYHDPTDCKEYKNLKQISREGHDRVDFDCWLLETKARLEPRHARLLTATKYDLEELTEPASWVILR